ncbi:MAG: hypothetical protein K8I00_07435 [Candidatus Omnitrophica bacterium]|nr:hypothetical protein [Candidatus Omnitrophota bacterium]
MTSQKRLSSQNAVVLLMTLILMLGLTVILLAYLTLVAVETRVAGQQTSHAKAFYLAEAGLNKAVWYLMNTAPDLSMDGSWRTVLYPADPGPNPTDPQQEPLADGTYTMWVESSGWNILITARGTRAGLSRNIQQEVVLLPGFPNIVIPLLNSWREI